METKIRKSKEQAFKYFNCIKVVVLTTEERTKVIEKLKEAGYVWEHGIFDYGYPFIYTRNGTILSCSSIESYEILHQRVISVDDILNIEFVESTFKKGDKVKLNTPRNGAYHSDEYYEGTIVDVKYIGENFIYAIDVTGCYRWTYATDRELTLIEASNTENDAKNFPLCSAGDFVLVRDNTQQNWKLDIFDHCNLSSINGRLVVCCKSNLEYQIWIPYKGNEDLYGTNNKPKTDTE